jgi:bifunctional DNase/RNase
MFRPIEFLTNITDDQQSTTYLMYKADKILLPIQIKVQEEYLNLYDTLKRIVLSLGATVSAIKIYLYQDDTYYAYITLKTADKILDINTNIETALASAQMFCAQILIEESVLDECGLKVTLDMLNEALVTDT